MDSKEPYHILQLSSIFQVFLKSGIWPIVAFLTSSYRLYFKIQVQLLDVFFCTCHEDSINEEKARQISYSRFSDFTKFSMASRVGFSMFCPIFFQFLELPLPKDFRGSNYTYRRLHIIFIRNSFLVYGGHRDVAGPTQLFLLG